MDLNRESLSSSSQDNLTISTSIIPGVSIEITSKEDLKANMGIMVGENAFICIRSIVRGETIVLQKV